MVIDEFLIGGKTVDSVDNTTVDNIHIKNDIFDSDFHFAKATGEGGLGTVECLDSVDEPIRSLKISGNTVSSTDNLYNPNNIVSSYQSYFDIAEDGKITGLVSDSRAWGYSNAQSYFNLEAGTYALTIDWANISRTDYARVELYKKVGDTISWINAGAFNTVSGNKTFVFTLTKNAIIAFFMKLFTGGEAYVMLNKGSTALPYEPFEPVAAVPTKLTVVGNIRSSTNNILYNKIANYGTYNGLTFRQEHKKSFFQVYGISTSAYGAYITSPTNPLFLEVGKTYTFSYQPTDAVLRWEIRFVDVNGVEKRVIALSSGNSISLSVNTGEIGIAITYVLAKGKDFGTVDNPTTIEYMLNEGDTALDYVSYQPVSQDSVVLQTVTIPSEYDMSMGNNILVDNIAHFVKYNNTDITQTDYEFSQKLFALKTYDGYTRVSVDSNVPVPIETNYWKQIKP